MFFSVMNSASPSHCFRSNRILSVPPTHSNSVPPTSQQEATCSIFLLIQLHSMNLVLYKHHSFIHCFVLSLKDQTHSTDSRKPFLEIDVKGGRERSHQSLSPTRERVLRGRKRSPGEENTQGSQMLDVQEERCHM